MVCSMIKVPGLSSLDDQGSKSLWNPELQQNVIICSLAHYPITVS